MNAIKEKLIGALIGIARATDGNEHLISPDSTAFLRKSLAADDNEELQMLLNRAEEIKRSMVPDCFLCANPCGRTAPYDLTQLNLLDDAVRLKKQLLLDFLITLAKSGRGEDTLLYRGLTVLGMDDYPEVYLSEILNEAETAE